jgi:hypothetical protein
MGRLMRNKQIAKLIGVQRQAHQDATQGEDMNAREDSFG